MNHCYAKMATSSQREGGRESAPPTPIKSSMEKKPQTADNDIQQLIARQDRSPHPQGWSSTLKQEDLQPAHMKEEEEELWISHEGARLLGSEEADLTKLPLTVFSVKAEDHEDKPPESLHWLCPSEENRGAELQSRSSQHIEADGDHCGGSQADKLLAPLSDSDDTTSHSPEDEDRDNTQEPLSSDTDCKSDMRTHTDNKHSESSQKNMGKESLTCSVCDKRFTFKSYLTQHMRTHTGEKPFACYVCGQRFTQKSHMLSHLRTHTGEKPFSCSVCAKSYSQKNSFANHMLKHSQNPFGCCVCGQRFPLKSQMVSHMMKHTGEHPFGCSVCGKNFSSKQYLTFHMMKHTGEIPFGCSVCAQQFTQKSRLVAHMRKHTGEKLFQCSVCGQNFPYRSSLTYHMRKHTGEKPFECSVCGQSFRLNALLVSHMRKHTGETPFACSVCGKNFTFKASLANHMQKHKGGKPFSCSVCGKSFSGKQASIYHTKACQEGLRSASDSQPKHYWNQKGFEWSF
ncbi:zinc finger protein OZF-like [Dunckerocampus dactyliophorus]|uniref:zinc finger protein OZF-like n=1 Tax=Dunckerocampus dactyliophorus TaxID=161453 RepID=UPI00240560EB|nr:zinc finger protein OZF-like [Dunckerocampus dactyliophorus]